MLMECVPGGELYSRIHNAATKEKLPKKHLEFYTANVVVALSHLHANGRWLL